MDKADTGLFKALEQWEASLETPFPEGEAATWLQTVRKVSAEVGAELERTIQRVHTEIFRDSKKEDPALVPRIKELEHADFEHFQLYRELHSRTEKLQSQATQAEPDELPLREPIDVYIEDDLAFIIDVRKQERGIASWFVEALDRDRGEAD
jgi:hypothetical protein